MLNDWILQNSSELTPLQEVVKGVSHLLTHHAMATRPLKKVQKVTFHGITLDVLSEQSLQPRKRNRIVQGVYQKQVTYERLLLEKLRQKMQLRISQQEEVVEILAVCPGLEFIIHLVTEYLKGSLGPTAQFELTVEDASFADARLTLVCRASTYPENFMDALAEVQETIDPMAPAAGHRLFLTTDFGDPWG